jgi:photosystem II stability/assembly factor-like uncharacterized protein/LysM repeat protein
MGRTGSKSSRDTGDHAARLVQLCLVGALLSVLLWFGVAAFWSAAASADEDSSNKTALKHEHESEEAEQIDASAGTSKEKPIPEVREYLSDSEAKAVVEAAPRTVRLSYKIHPGDTLSEIAPRLNTSVEHLAAYNAIADPNLIYSGNKLYFEIKNDVQVTVKKREEGKGERADQPDEAAEFRLMQQENENGKIPANALLEAHEKAERMEAEPVPGTASTQESSTGELQPMTANIDRSNWRWRGPGNVGGRIRSLVIHPTNAQTMWAGSVGGGIWKTTDGGTSWRQLDDFMANLAVSSLVVDRQNPNVLYAGTGEGVYNADALRGAGIFKSTDGGATWNQLSSTATSNFYYVNRLSISPGNSQVLLAATRTGIWRSTDGGATWTQRLSLADNVGLLQVIFDPNDGNKAVASGNYGQAYYSTDGGVTWQAASKPWTSTAWANRVEMAYAPGSSNIVYASVNQEGGLIYKSTDGGRTFALRSTVAENYFVGAGNQGSYDNAIWVSPTNPDVVVVGGIELWRSRDGGQTLTQISRWDCGSEERAKDNPDCGGVLSAHADQHAIVSHPGYNGDTNRTLFFANDGGVYKTQDILTVAPLSGWQEMNNNLGITQFYSGAGNVGSDTLVGGTQDNGTPVTTTGGTEDWGNMYEGDGGFVAADPTSSSILYGEYVYLSLYRSTNGGDWASYIDGRYWTGTTWAWKPAPYRIPDAQNQTALFIAPFILDPNNSNRILAGGQSLWRTNDAKTTNTSSSGPSWASIRGTTQDAQGRTLKISAIAVAKGNSDIIYVGYTNGLIYKTTNGTAASPTWTRVDTDAMPARFTHRITISPSNPSVVYATFGGFSDSNIYRSTDGGATWSDRTGTGATGLPLAPVRSLVVHPSNPSWLYVGTEVGVFASEDGGANWSPTSDGPANVSVDELFWQGTRLAAATHGRGIFDIDTQARPANDDFANAQTLTGSSATAAGRNVGATKETGEPNHAGNAGGKSIWYRWTAPSNGTLTIDTRGSKTSAGAILDTTLGVYTGSGVNALSAVASNDDENNAGGIITSKIGPFAVTGGTTYRIAVDGYNSGTGAVSGDTVLNLAFTSTGDNVAPSVALTSPQEGAIVSGTNVTLSADATDNVGVGRVEFLVNGSVAGTDTTPSGSSYSVSWDSTTVSNGSVQIRARAFDTSTNQATSTARTLTVDNAQTLQAYQEKDPDHTGYAGWYFYRDGNFSGGRSAYATSAGNTATFNFRGTRIVWKTARFSNSGKTAVYLDGKKVKTFDAYAPNPQYNVTGYAKRGLANRRHTIKLVLTGGKNASSGGIYNDLDRFIVGRRVYQEDAPQVTYGSWRGAANANASGGSYRVGGLSNPAYFFYFTGPRVDLITARGPSFGSATVEVVDRATDAVAKTVTLNLNAATLQWQVEHSITGLDASKTYYLRVFSANGRPVMVDSYKAIPPQGAQATAGSPAAEDAKPEAPGEG